MPNEIRADMLKVKRMISEVEMIIGKCEGETELVNKLIDAENLLTYCMSRLENDIVLPCKELKSCEMVSDNPMDYVQVALALETLAYYNKNYLAKCLGDNCNISREIQSLLIKALKEGADNG